MPRRQIAADPERSRVPFCYRNIPAMLLRKVRGLEKFPERPEDKGERSAQLMAYVGKEPALQLIQFARLLIQPGKFFMGFLQPDG